MKARHVPRTLSFCDTEYPQLASNRAVAGWRGGAKDELGVEHEMLEGKILTSIAPVGLAMANSIWDLKWFGYTPEYERHAPHVYGIVDSASACKGVKHTTGVTKVVRHDGPPDNRLAGNTRVVMIVRVGRCV